jgi:hypothetical protein
MPNADFCERLMITQNVFGWKPYKRCSLLLKTSAVRILGSHADFHVLSSETSTQRFAYIDYNPQFR